ncbi:hypothetical protein [Rufibacter sp. XAAS-G3-1]|uniref:hypothetical protein n=1 Tax=Rufibacter sp. XAAS-G3-1 TaxID=2729134 RepID=UPI0015E798CB|nr:hypothetical protein [Rufibacter sp. XAAS-G3-1]
MSNMYGSHLKSHQYSGPTEQLSVANLVLAMRLSRLGHTADYITDFVTGSWNPMPSTSVMHAPCPELTLPCRQQK